MKGAIACAIRANDNSNSERVNLELSYVRTVAQSLGLSVIVDSKPHIDLPASWEAISSIVVAFVAIDSSSEEISEYELLRLVEITKEVPVALLSRRDISIPRVKTISLIEGTVDGLLDFLQQADEDSSRSLLARYKASSAFALAKGFEDMQRPLTELLSQATQLGSTPDTSPERLVSTIQNTASLALFRMHNLADLATMNSPSFAFQAEPFALDSVVGFCGKIAQTRAHRTRHEFLVHIDPLIPNRLIGDAKRLQQIVVNLLESPLLSQEPSGIIFSVFLEERRETSVALRFSVATSSGNEASTNERLFNNLGELLEYASTRSDASQTWLATAFRSIQRLGGTLSVKGGAGGGSRLQFTVELEIDHAPSNKEVHPSTNQLPTADRVIRVLVVDDDAINRRLLEIQLRKMGYVTMQAVSGAEAIRLYERYDFDLVFMDISMPHIDGIEATEAIRIIELRTGRFTPIVIISAHPREIALNKCKSIQVEAFLSTPIDRDSLVSTLSRWTSAPAQ